MSVHVRPYLPTDHDFVLSLAPRLTIGMPSWRDPQRCLSAVEGWIKDSIERYDQESMVFVAEDDQGQRLGFATVTHETHFTGERQAYIGELAASEAAEGRGAGRALLQACEGWAREQGDRILSLATGAANEHALGFYDHFGYRREDVKLVKLLS